MMPTKEELLLKQEYIIKSLEDSTRRYKLQRRYNQRDTKFSEEQRLAIVKLCAGMIDLNAQLATIH